MVDVSVLFGCDSCGARKIVSREVVDATMRVVATLLVEEASPANMKEAVGRARALLAEVGLNDDEKPKSSGQPLRYMMFLHPNCRMKLKKCPSPPLTRGEGIARVLEAIGLLPSPGQGAAHAAIYVGERICVPRDLGFRPAKELRRRLAAVHEATL